MPNRILRPWLDSEAVNTLNDAEEVFFLRLIMAADDYGRFYGTPQLLKSYLYPLKDKRTADMPRLVAACEKAGMIASYEVAGRRYIQILKFKQQVRTAESKFPEPPPDILARCETSKKRVATANQTQIKCVANDMQMRSRCVADDKQMTSSCTRNTETETIYDMRERKTEQKESRFAPPSLEEVRAYCLQRKNGIDPEHFISFYESKGWMIGKNKMKDWRAAIRNWESRQRDDARRNAQHPSFDYDPNESGTDESKWGFQ